MDKRLMQFHYEDITYTNATLLHFYIIYEDRSSLKRKKEQITKEVVEMKCEKAWIDEKKSIKNIEADTLSLYGEHSGSKCVSLLGKGSLQIRIDGKSPSRP